jgi:hypothetical protein
LLFIISYINYRFEIDEIEQRVNREREKYQAATQDKADGLSAIPFISINDKVRYNLVSQAAQLVQ